MPNEPVRLELLVMRAEDQRVRQELLDANELGGHYVPRMEAVHVKNAARLRYLIAQHGWPAEDLVGKDGAEAAWLIAQHAIGEPEFQRDVLRLLQSCAAENRVPKWHAAYLEDRIALRSEEHTSELQSQSNLVCRLLLEKKNINQTATRPHYFVVVGTRRRHAGACTNHKDNTATAELPINSLTTNHTFAYRVPYWTSVTL